MPGIQVDGQDVSAVYKCTSDAVARARRGEGPTLIEAQTYRFDEHQVGLFIEKDFYRAYHDVEDYKNRRDPIKLFRQTLTTEGFGSEELDEIEREATDAVNEAIRFAEESPFPALSTLYNNY